MRGEQRSYEGRTIPKKKHNKLPMDKRLVADGRDTVVIDDGGSGSSGGSPQAASTSGTTSEKSKKSEAKKKTQKSGTNTTSSVATGTKAAFDPEQNPEAALPPSAQTAQQSVPATDTPREVQYLEKPTQQSTPTSTFSIPVTVAPQYPATGTRHSGSGRAFGDAAATQTSFANPLALGGPNPYAAPQQLIRVVAEIENPQLSGNPNFANRVKDTVIGGAKRSLASDLNSTANAYDLTRGARERMMNEYLADYEHGLEQAQYVLQQLEETGADARDI